MNIIMKRILLSLMVLAYTAVAVIVAASMGTAESGTSMSNISPLLKNVEPLDKCSQDAKDQPRTALAGCLNAKFQIADKEMGIVYGRIEGELKSTDSAGTQAALASLAESQRAFVTFRQAECQRVGDAAMGGSGAGDFRRACEVRLTLWRIDELESN